MTDSIYAIRPLSDADVDAIVGWQYAPPYDVYDFSAEPDDVEEIRSATQGRRPWFAVDELATLELVGFLDFTPADDVVEIGLGLRPDHTGRGLGPAFVESALAFARDRWHPSRFTLDVLPWNERAARAYEHAGFVREDVYLRRFPNGVEREFLRMSRPA